MEIITKVVSISRCQSLEVNDVVTAIRSLDSFDFDGASNLDTCLVGGVNHLVHFDLEGFSHFQHLLMELLSSYDGFLIIDSTVFGQTAQITIVQNTWDDRLADHSVSLEIDQAGCQVVKLGHID